MTTTEKRIGRWKAGASGNPRGRPPGSTPTGRLRAAIAEHIPAILEQLVSKAREGDVGAAKLLLERVIPAVKPTEEPVVVDLSGCATLAEKGNAVISAVATGTIPPAQGAILLAALASVARLVGVEELVARIEALEQRK